LLNTTVIAFKVLRLGTYAPMTVPSPHFKTILELVFFGKAFRTAVVLLPMTFMTSKYLPFNISFTSGTEKSHWGLDPVNWH